jgi:hypothetical protein
MTRNLFLFNFDPNEDRMTGLSFSAQTMNDAGAFGILARPGWTRSSVVMS